MEKHSLAVECQRCKWRWYYTGNNEYWTTCPHCSTKVNLRKFQLGITAKVGHQVEQSPIVEAKTTRRERSVLSHG